MLWINRHAIAVVAAIPYETRLGNLLVSYGGQDPALLSKVKAAVAAVKH